MLRDEFKCRKGTSIGTYLDYVLISKDATVFTHSDRDPINLLLRNTDNWIPGNLTGYQVCSPFDFIHDLYRN